MNNTRASHRGEPRRARRSLSEFELGEVADRVADLGGARLGEIVLLLGWTGLRPSEAREMQVSDVIEGPVFGCGSNAHDRRGTQSWSPRPERIDSSRFRMSSGWDDLSDGRQLYGPRHTAICLWLASGMPISTVKEWAGHADIITTNVYATFPGTNADRVGSPVLNVRERPRNRIRGERTQGG